MPATKKPAAYVLRMQMADDQEVQDVKRAYAALNERAGVTLSHNQLIVALARFYLKRTTRTPAIEE